MKLTIINLFNLSLEIINDIGIYIVFTIFIDDVDYFLSGKYFVNSRKAVVFPDPKKPVNK